MTAGKLRDLEKRLRDEPDNLGLRVMFAGALCEAGRTDEAIELYRSVAMAYRDQGRTQQAIAVCKSILELAPRDAISLALLEQLAGASAPPLPPPPSAPGQRGSFSDATPLPRAVPYHVADPTTTTLAKLSARDILDIPTLAEGSESAATIPTRAPPRAGSDSGLAAAARRISQALSKDESYDTLDVTPDPDADADAHTDVAAELSTRRIPRIATADEEERLAELGAPPPELDTLEDDEHTEPFDLLGARSQRGALRPMSPFFAPLPDAERQAVLGRFIPRTVTAGTYVIRQGEHGHPLVLVGRGRLDVRCERAGALVQIGTIAAGEYVGEIALLARAPAQAHVIAATDAELLLLAPTAFHEVIAGYPALRAELADTAARRTREYAARLR